MIEIVLLNAFYPILIMVGFFIVTSFLPKNKIK